MNEAHKPTVLIYAFMPDSQAANALGAGLEEEGVPFSLIEKQSDTAEELAEAAARDSILHCGIGLCGQTAVMTIDGLPNGDMLFATQIDWKTLGANAARAVKKQKFKAMHENCKGGQHS